MRSVPLTLYSDDTSGNKSKKWNKHMSYYCTLSGLPPKLTNQEFNIRGLACSNTANALEMGAQIILEIKYVVFVLVKFLLLQVTDKVYDEYSEMAEKGFVCYDQSLESDVLVVPWILCHLGDSPMHAEITNTNNPSTSLRPCRVCDLGVDERADKQHDIYLRDFVGVDIVGAPVCIQFISCN